MGAAAAKAKQADEALKVDMAKAAKMQAGADAADAKYKASMATSEEEQQEADSAAARVPPTGGVVRTMPARRTHSTSRRSTSARRLSLSTRSPRSPLLHARLRMVFSPRQQPLLVPRSKTTCTQQLHVLLSRTQPGSQRSRLPWRAGWT